MCPEFWVHIKYNRRFFMYNEHIMNEGRKGGTMEKVLLNMKAISKTFGSVQALKEVSLDLYAGEVLALMGENGAGKSTLMNILSGSLQPTKGEIYLKGEKVTVPGPIAAKKLGISRKSLWEKRKKLEIDKKK